MFKFLLLFPLLAVTCALGAALLLPLLALAPLLLIIALAVAIPLLVLRVLIGLVFGLGGLLIGVLGLVFAVACAGLLMLGVLAAHLFLPLLALVGLIWLIRRASRPAPPLQLEHHAH